MDTIEWLIPYVVQKIVDEGGLVSRTRLLKTIYLIDVAYFRRHRRTLTGWEWVFHFYGPYTYAYPEALAKLGFTIEETENRIYEGKQFYSYKVYENQGIDATVGIADQMVIDSIIARWALEDLNLLLNHVYFRTEPMVNAARGQVLDFNSIPLPAPQPDIDPNAFIIPEKSMSRLRSRLLEARCKYDKEISKTAAHLAAYPLRVDDSYRAAMEKRDREETQGTPEGLQVTVE